MQPQKFMNTYKFRLKGAWNWSFLANQMQNFLYRQVGVQTSKIIDPLITLDYKGPEIKLL